MKSVLMLSLAICFGVSFAAQANSFNDSRRAYTKFYVQVYDRGFADSNGQKGLLFFRDLFDAYAWKPAGEYAGTEGRHSDLRELEFLRSLQVGIYYCEKGHYNDVGQSYVGIVEAGECRPVSNEELSKFQNKFKRTY